MTKNMAKAVPSVFDRRVLEGLGIASVVAGGLFVAAAVAAPKVGFWYLVWNLFLAYIPLVLTVPLVRAAARYGWHGWQTVLWGLVWVVWLPNSFYVVTDVAHLLDHRYGLDPLWGVMLFGTFAALGETVGFMCMLPAHREMRRQVGGTAAYLLAELVLLVSAIAIYVGRTLRWNSWDVLLHPLAVVRDVGSGLVAGNQVELGTTLLFFVVLSGAYAAIWRVFGERT